MGMKGSIYASVDINMLCICMCIPYTHTQHINVDGGVVSCSLRKRHLSTCLTSAVSAHVFARLVAQHIFTQLVRVHPSLYK